MADYGVMQDLIAGVSDAMEVFGKEIILRSFTNTGPEYNPTRTAIDTSVLGINIDFGLNERDGVMITSSDTQYLIEAKDIDGNAIEPDMSMRILDGSEYQIKNIERVKPASTAIMYVIHAGL